VRKRGDGGTVGGAKDGMRSDGPCDTRTTTMADGNHLVVGGHKMPCVWAIDKAVTTKYVRHLLVLSRCSLAIGMSQRRRQ